MGITISACYDCTCENATEELISDLSAFYLKESTIKDAPKKDSSDFSFGAVKIQDQLQPFKFGHNCEDEENFEQVHRNLKLPSRQNRHPLRFKNDY